MAAATKIEPIDQLHSELIITKEEENELNSDAEEETKREEIFVGDQNTLNDIKVEEELQNSDPLEECSTPEKIRNESELCSFVGNGTSTRILFLKLTSSSNNDERSKTGAIEEHALKNKEILRNEKKKDFVKNLNEHNKTCVPTNSLKCNNNDILHDIICSLLKTLFLRRSIDERNNIITLGRPVPELDIYSPDTKKDGQIFSRSFRSSWYGSHKWLCGSVCRKALFCWPCLLLSKNRVVVWVNKGFSDLKNLSSRIKQHDSSKEHLLNALELRRLENNRRKIKTAHNEHNVLKIKLYNEDVKRNRVLLSYLIDVVVVLAKQELPFCSHNESDNSENFEELFKLLIGRDVEIQTHLKKIENVFSGVSKIIQNDLIECVADHMRDKIKKEIDESTFFTVQVDDTTDISETSQCSISVRLVDELGITKEHLLSFFEVSDDRTADALFNLITDQLKPYNNYSNKLVAQCYDGASIMAGSLKDLQGKIKEVAPNALLTHCYFHYLNLILQHASKCIPKCRIYFSTISSIRTFFNQSVKRTFILNSVIPESCEIGWNSKSKIIHVINSQWNNFKLVFQSIVDDPTSTAESINGARCYLEQFGNFEFSFLTSVYNEIFNITTPLAQTLQAKCLDINSCQNQIHVAVDKLKQLKTDPKFHELIAIADSKSITNYADDPPTKRIKIVGNNLCRGLYFEIIDIILNQIDVRFTDLNELSYFSLVQSNKFEVFQVTFPTKLINNLIQQYKNVFNGPKLHNELSVIYNEKQFSNLSIEEILKVFIDNELCQQFSEAYKLFKLFATIPITTFNADKSVSCLKRIRNHFRRINSQNRSNSLSLLSIEKEYLEELSNDENFVDDIIRRFSMIRNSGINLIFKTSK